MRALLFALLLPTLLLPGMLAQAQQDAPLVLTSLAPVHQAALALLEGSGVRVENVPTNPRPLDALPAFFAQRRGEFAELFREADAVVGIMSLWPPDPLYAAAREADIRVVPIDAARPWSLEQSGVAVAESPVSGGVSPWFWTAPSNIVRMLDILSRDLQALFPAQAAVIAANLEEERRFYQSLRSDFEARLLEAEEPVVFALAEEFIYLCRDLGLFVEGYFVKQDIDWTAEDHAALTDTLRASDVRVVIHKWEPAPSIQDAIGTAGARLAVLDAMESTTSLRESVAGNLDRLLQALAPRP